MTIMASAKSLTVLIMLSLLLLPTRVLTQAPAATRYEVEVLKNPNAGGKDTREVNAVLIFENDRIKVQSRRSKEVFKELMIADIRAVEHSYSKQPVFSPLMAAAIAFSVVTLLPVFLFAIKKDKHWLTVVAGENFAVLKIENDNYKLIRTEFLARNIPITDIDERKR
jgi:hypothetical protein